MRSFKFHLLVGKYVETVRINAVLWNMWDVFLQHENQKSESVWHATERN